MIKSRTHGILQLRFETADELDEKRCVRTLLCKIVDRERKHFLERWLHFCGEQYRHELEIECIESQVLLQGAKANVLVNPAGEGSPGLRDQRVGRGLAPHFPTK